jgi:muconate cycloisomerase
VEELAIDRVETAILDVPLVRPHRFARTGMDAQPILLVTVTTRGGATGVGEGVVPGGPWWGGESVETMQVIVERYLAPVLIGRRVAEIDGIQQAMNDVVNANLHVAPGLRHAGGDLRQRVVRPAAHA